MVGFLAVVSLVLVAAIVAAVAYHLIGIYLALRRGADHLEKLAGGLVRIRDNTGDLNAKVDTINGGLSALLEPLAGANGNLAAIVDVARRK
ncbi:MAG: hypothetical protein ACTS3R_21380 [Inquilinaceae bacterium]